MTKPSRWEWHPPTHQKVSIYFYRLCLEVGFDCFHKPYTIQLIYDLFMIPPFRRYCTNRHLWFSQPQPNQPKMEKRKTTTAILRWLESWPLCWPLVPCILARLKLLEATNILKSSHWKNRPCMCNTSFNRGREQLFFQYFIQLSCINIYLSVYLSFFLHFFLSINLFIYLYIQ